MNKKDQELVMYIIVNSDLKMSPGKVAAQVAHGAIKSLFKSENDEIAYWLGNSQTKIILQASEQELLYLLRESFNIGVYPVYDEGRTEIPSGSLTVVALPIQEKSILKQKLSKFKLYK